MLSIGDGSYSGQAVWAGLPPGVELLTRCAKNRALYALPERNGRVGRPRKYGARAPRPDAWLGERWGWRRVEVAVRGRVVPLTYRVEGPYVVRGAAERPLFLLVVRGVAKRSPRHKRREPAYWLVSATARDGRRELPWPAPALLGWAWQRWEVEVAHRAQKSEFGLGEPQCWGPRAAVTAVQWVGWCYALTVLAGIATWGLGRGPIAAPGRWRRDHRRWSLAQLVAGLRSELWDLGGFRPVWSGTGGDWWEMADWAAAQTNALLGASRT